MRWRRSAPAPMQRGMSARTLSPLLAFAAALALAFTATAPAHAASCAGAARAAQSAPAENARAAVLCLVNAQRRGHGLRPVRASRDLERAAARHSADMVRRRFFDHVSPSGSTLTSRVRATGYLRGSRGWSLGEAIAWGSGSLATPATIVDSWMNSPPHRAILLGRDFRDMGIGIATGTPSGGADGATFTLDAGRH
jgi:uncharacterized protein YkwD